MSVELGPGVWVEGLTDTTDYDGILLAPAGTVFCISWFRDRRGYENCADCGKQAATMGFTAFPCFTPDQGGWCPCTYKPIYGGRTDFTPLLEPLPERTREDA